VSPFGRTVVLDPSPTDAGRMHEVDLFDWYFRPEGLLATAEEVSVGTAAG
jgi:hypothetical protein